MVLHVRVWRNPISPHNRHRLTCVCTTHAQKIHIDYVQYWRDDSRKVCVCWSDGSDAIVYGSAECAVAVFICVHVYTSTPGLMCRNVEATERVRARACSVYYRERANFGAGARENIRLNTRHTFGRICIHDMRANVCV